MSNKPFVSVVINYFNEKDNIDFAPNSLASQTYRDFEVVLVDDASTDGTTEEILKKYSNLLNIRVIRLPKTLGLRPARSIGVKNAQGRIIVILDLHTQFDKLFLERMVGAIEENPRVGACGCLVLGTGEGWFNRGFRTFEEFCFGLRASSGSYKYIFGCAAAFRSEAFELIGDLSENEVTEDEDVSWRLIKAGSEVLLLKNTVVYHKEPNKFPEFIRKLFFIGLRAAPVLSKYKSKLLYPQNLARFFVLPLFLILLLVLKAELLLLLVPSFLICLTVVFALKNNSFKDAFYGSLTTVLFAILTTIGFYYGLILTILKRMKILKQFNVDVKAQNSATISNPRQESDAPETEIPI